jgi:tetratricopeptide (TPR) repeat protein
MNVDRILTRAKAHTKKGEWNKARALYTSLLQTFPQNQQAKIELKKLPSNIIPNTTPDLTQIQIDSVVALYHAGKTDQALETLATLTINFPTVAILFNIQGVCYADRQQFDAAVQSYQQALQIQPDYTEAHYNLSVAFNNLGQLDKAIVSYKKTLKIKPDYPEAHYNLGVIFNNQGKLSAAISCYQHAIKFKPNYTKAHSNLGIALKDMGQLQASVKSYQQVLKLQPHDPEALYNLGNVLHDLDHGAAAITHYERALKINPNYIEACNNLGIALKEAGHLNQAIKHYEDALKIKPDYAEAHYNLGVILQETGQLKEAVNHYEQAVKIKPRYAEAYNNLGMTLQDSGQPDTAINNYKNAIRINPNYAEAHNNLGVTLNETHQSVIAINSYHKAIQLKPDYAEAHYNLGIALKERGQLNDAINSYQQALKIKPTYAEALIHLSIYSWLDDDLSRLSAYLGTTMHSDHNKNQKNKFIEPYKLLLNNLLHYRKTHQEYYFSEKKLPLLYVIGESHCLPAANTVVSLKGKTYRIQSKIIIGCKMWHLANNQINGYKKQIETILNTIPNNAKIVLTFGEIDCRLNEGIIKFHQQTNNNLTQSIQSLSHDYIKYVTETLRPLSRSIIISGIPLPSPCRQKLLSITDVQLLATIIKELNSSLRTNTVNEGFQFLDLQQITQNDSTHFSNSSFIDDLHVTPSTFIAALATKTN